MKQSFYTMGVEVLRIEDGKYYIPAEDEMCIIEVDAKTFKQELEKYAKYVKDYWDKTTREKYDKILKEIK